MSNVTAISIAADMNKLLALVETSEEMTMEMIADTMEGLELELGAKLDAVMGVVRNTEGLAKTCSDEMARLANRKKQFETKVKNLKKYILDCIIEAEKDGMKTASNTFTARKGLVNVIIDNENLLPDDLVATSVITAPDKKAIKERLEAGEAIPGAHIEIGQRSLQVR